MMFKDNDLLNFVRGQATTIEREVNETTFPEILYPSFLPVVTQGNPFAESVTYVSTKKAGQAGFIDGNAGDVPMADSQMNVDVHQVYTAGIGYGWGWEEVNQARQMGFDLQSTRAVSARRAYEEKVDDIAFEGDTGRGLKGLIDAPNATKVTTGFTGKWSANTADAQAIAGDLVTLINGTGRGNRHTADTLVIPQSELVYAQTNFFGNGSKTAIDFVKEHFPGIRIAGLVALESVGGKFRYLAYKRSPESMAFYLPMPHRFLEVHRAGPLRFEVPGVFRVGGLNVKRKEDFAYGESS